MVQVRGRVDDPKIKIVTLDGLRQFFVRVLPFWSGGDKAN